MRAATACFLAALSAAAGAVAEEGGPVLLDEAAFLALVDGKTAHFSADGAYYGSETYYEGNRSVWRDSGGECEEGIWRMRGPDICFQYNSISCWRIYRAPEGGHYAVSQEGFRVDFESIETGALSCGIPVS